MCQHQDWILIFDNLLKHPSGKASRGCRCDMCLRLKPPIIPASPTSPRLFSHHRTSRSISGSETTEESSLDGDHDLQFWSLNVTTVNNINKKNGELSFFICYLKLLFIKTSKSKVQKIILQ